jgi:rhodanese-related sulfurtransferase
MANRWQRHGIVAVLGAMALALAACDDGKGDADAGPDVVDPGCACVDLVPPDAPPDLPADAPEPTDVPADLPPPDVPVPEDLPPPDVPPQDVPAPEDVPAPDDVFPADVPLPDELCACVDVPPPDLPPPTDLGPTDVPPEDPGLVDVPPATLGAVSPADLKAELEHKDFLLINVHVPSAGQIPGTDTHITYQDVDAIAAYMGSELGVKTVVYCLSNYMSTLAGNALVERGYRNVRYLDGGMGAWKAAGYPFEN